MATSTDPGFVDRIPYYRKNQQTINGVFGAVLVVLLWQVVGSMQMTESLLPAPTEIVAAWFEFEEILMRHFGFTMKTAVYGFVVGVVLALVVGIVLALDERLREALVPIIVGTNALPRITLAPFMAFYLRGFAARWVFVSWMCFFPMVMNTIEGLSYINEDFEDLMDLHEASIWQQFKYIRFPNSLPFLLDGLKIAVALAITGAIVIEFVLVRSGQGLGYIAYRAITYYNLPLLFAAVMFLAVFSLLAYVVLFAIQDRVVHWKETNFIAGEGE